MKASFDLFWNDVQAELEEAYLFIDSEFSDILHCNVGPQQLLQSKTKQFKPPTCIYDLSNLPTPELLLLDSTWDPQTPRPRAVLLLSGFLHTYTEQIKQALSIKPFGECVIFCSISNFGHARLHSSVQKAFGQSGAYNWISEIARSSMVESSLKFFKEDQSTSTSTSTVKATKANLTSPIVAVLHFGPSLCLFSPTVFTLPLSSNKNSSCLFIEDQGLLTERLSSAISGLGFKCDLIFALGSNSRKIASTIQQPQNQQAQPNEATLKQASLILMDRTLDLVPCCSHNNSAALEMILSLLEPSHYSCDVSVNTAPLYGTGLTNMETFGNLIHPEEEESSQRPIFEASLSMQLKQLTLYLQKQLYATLNFNEQEQLEQEQMISILSKCAKEKGTWSSEHSMLFDWCSAVIETQQCFEHSLWEQILSAEKVLLLTGNNESFDICEHICGLVGRLFQTSSGTQRLSVDSILCLCAMAYSIAGPNFIPNPQSETSLKTALVRELSCNDIEIAEKKISLAFEKLHLISSSRKNMHDFMSLTKPAAPGSSATIYSSLLEQLLTQIFNNQPIPDLILMKDAIGRSVNVVGGLLKKGFGTIWSRASSSGNPNRDPLPSDNQIMIFFFVGGVSCKELALIHEFAAKNPSKQLIIGSTCISTPYSIGLSLL